MAKTTSLEDDDYVLEEEASALKKSGKYLSTERLFHLVRFLMANDCTRDDIFASLEAYYKIDEPGSERFASSRQAAGRLLERDICFLRGQGFVIKQTRPVKSQPARYHLAKESGPFPVFLLTDTEVESLAFLFNLFADPVQDEHTHQSQPLPQPPAPHPFAADMLHLLEKFACTLPPTQHKAFDGSIKKPFVYFQISPVADYLSHRTTIDTIVRAISLRQQIEFTYTPSEGRQEYMPHRHVDPYYVIYTEGHFYLIGYSHQTSTFLEYRIDRIRGESLKIQPDTIDVERRRRPVEFHFWIDKKLVKQGLSQRWLSQTEVREEVYENAQGKTQLRVLVRATAYNEWRIIPQLLRYGDRVELVDPPHLRQKLRDTLKHMQSRYEND